MVVLAAAPSRPTEQVTDDLDLVAGVRAGSDRAFELLYMRYQSRIAAYVRGMVHDDGRAEDITQEVFISALRRMRDTEREIAFKPWIYEIAKNACIDAFRRTRHRSEVSYDAHGTVGGDDARLVDTRATPDAAVDAKVDLDNLCGAFGGLSEVHHQVLVLRELEGLSYSAIGERLGMSRAAVESTLFRARRRLGEEYDELVSGRRCVRVRGLIDAGGVRATGAREQRRMDRHLSHCQPCRRHALIAGVDLGPRRSLRPAAARIAALLPIPPFLLRHLGGDEAADRVLSQRQGTVAQLSANVAAVDPGMLANWSKAIVAAAAIAVAGVGAGTAITNRPALDGLLGRRPPVINGPAANRSAGGGAARERATARRGHRARAQRIRATGAAVTGKTTAGTGSTAKPAAPTAPPGGGDPLHGAAPTAPRPGDIAVPPIPGAAGAQSQVGHLLDGLGDVPGSVSGPLPTDAVAGAAGHASGALDGVREQVGSVVTGVTQATSAIPVAGGAPADRAASSITSTIKGP